MAWRRKGPHNGRSAPQANEARPRVEAQSTKQRRNGGRREKSIEKNTCRLTFLTRPGRWFVRNLDQATYLPTYQWKDVTKLLPYMEDYPYKPYSTLQYPA